MTTVKVDQIPGVINPTEGVDYQVLQDAPQAGDFVRIRDGNGGELFGRMPLAATPQPNNPGNPYFGKQKLPRTKFLALLQSILGSGGYNRLRNDDNSLWVFDVVMAADVIDVDDVGGDFLQILTYLQNTDGTNNQPLMTAQQVTDLMAAWP